MAFFLLAHLRTITYDLELAPWPYRRLFFRGGPCEVLQRLNLLLILSKTNCSEKTGQNMFVSLSPLNQMRSSVRGGAWLPVNTLAPVNALVHSYHTCVKDAAVFISKLCVTP